MKKKLVDRMSWDITELQLVQDVSEYSSLKYIQRLSVGLRCWLLAGFSATETLNGLLLQRRALDADSGSHQLDGSRGLVGNVAGYRI